MYSELTNYKGEELGTVQICSIFLHIPQLLPYFLNYFYDLEYFTVNNFDYEEFQKALFYTYENIEELIQKLTHMLKNKNTKAEYCNTLYSFLKEIDKTHVKNTYLIKFDFELRNYSN